MFSFEPEARPMGYLLEQLESEVRDATRRHGLLVWLDKPAAFTRWVDGLGSRQEAPRFPYPVVGFRGSFLELLQSTAPLTTGIDRSPVVVHLGGLDEAAVTGTPALELLRSGHKFDLDLPTLVQRLALGRVEPHRVAAKLAEPDLTLEAADAWLDDAVRARRGGLEGLLDLMPVAHFVDHLLGARDNFAGESVDEPLVALVTAHANRALGLTEEWRHWIVGSARPTSAAEALEQETLAILTWALGVEFVHDLLRLPRMRELVPLRNLQAPLVESCRRIARHLRSQAPDRYERIAIELEERLGQERTSGSPADLGKIDTLRFEAELLLEAAIKDVGAGHWKQTVTWVEDRATHESFWLKRNPHLGAAWELVAQAAKLLQLLRQQTPALLGCRSADDALDAYTAGSWEVDNAHRRLLQRIAVLLEPQLPFYSALRDALRETRQRWRTWADTLARAFSQICRQHGFLPEPDRQQRHLFDQVVKPRDAKGRTALFLVDALRFEMAQDLAADFKAQGAEVTLQARLAELPSITSIGMNVLAPVTQDGSLHPVLIDGEFRGFKAGEFTVRDLDTRQRAMFLRVGGNSLAKLSLDDACDLPPEKLKPKLQNSALVLVHSLEIDNAGEAGFGLTQFDDVLRRLVVACRNLVAAGVRRFVITADHGFLLQDDTTEAYAHGRKTDPSRRHVWSPDIHEQTDLVTVPLSALRYEGVSGCLLMPEDTRVFDRGAANRNNFVHGGNSLQERVIPALCVRFQDAEGPELTCRLEVQPATPIMGLQSLRVRALPDAKKAILPFTTPEADLLLEVPDRPDIFVSIRGTRPEGRLVRGRIRIPVSDEFTDVFFTLSGQDNERVVVSVRAVESTIDAGSVRTEALFDVAGTTPVGAVTLATKPAPDDWLARIPEAAGRSLLTPSCGTGRLTERRERTVAIGLRDMAATLRERVAATR